MAQHPVEAKSFRVCRFLFLVDQATEARRSSNRRGMRGILSALRSFAINR